MNLSTNWESCRLWLRAKLEIFVSSIWDLTRYHFWWRGERCGIFIRFSHHLSVFIKWRSTFKSLSHTLEFHVDFVQWKKWLKLWYYDEEENRINFYALWMWLDDETFHINSKDNFVFCFYAMPQWLHSKMLKIKFIPYYSCRRKKTDCCSFAKFYIKLLHLSSSCNYFERICRALRSTTITKQNSTLHLLNLLSPCFQMQSLHCKPKNHSHFCSCEFHSSSSNWRNLKENRNFAWVM